ncbi:MAG: methyltransferase domain-containing protein [Campylobacterota bacterium]|nr:methyltransferase domain-containing protein [Campylobacterota bacterium]
MKTNTELVHHLTSSGVLLSQNIIDAFLNIDRADFIKPSFLYDTYGDYPLQIGHGQTNSQPTTVAMMLEMLQPQEGDHILDIGSGSGWTTALLAYIVKKLGSVTGVERIDELVRFGLDNLSKYNLTNATIIKADDHLGIVSKQFDKILVSAAAKQFPYELLEQLKPNGKLVIPVQNSIFEVKKDKNADIIYKEHYGFNFVPLII